MADKWLKVLMGEANKRKDKSRGKSDRLEVLMIHTPAPLPGAAPMEQLPDTFYTGGGPDGRVQPDRLAMVDMTTNPPSRYHEGEIVKDVGGIKHVTPARDAVRRVQGGPAAMIPTNESQQIQMEQQAQGAGLPGFSDGGYTGETTYDPNYGTNLLNQAGQDRQADFESTDYLAPSQINITQPQSAPVLQGLATVQPPRMSSGGALYSGQPPRMSSGGALYSGQPPRMSSGGALYSGQPQPPEPTPPATTPPATTPPAPVNDPYSAGTQEGFNALRDRARGEDPVAAMIREKSGQEFDASAAALRSRMQQELLSRGESADVISSMMSQYDRGDRISRAKMLSDLGIAEAKATQEAQDALITQGMTLERHTAAMADLKRTQAGKDAAGYLSNALMQNPNFDWRSDTAAQDYLRRAWEAQGSPGDFNSWADQLVGGLSTSKGTAIVNALKNETWYKSAPSGGEGVYRTESGQYTKEFYDELLFPALSLRATMPGVSWGLDANDNLFIKDDVTGTTTGGTTGGTPTGTDGAPAAITTPEGQAAAYQTFDAAYDGVDLNADAFAAYVADNGSAPVDEDAWIKWSLTKRTFTADQVEDARMVLDEADWSVMNMTDNGLAQYIEQNDGKLPRTAAQWDRFTREQRVFDADNGYDIAAAQTLLGSSDAEKVEEYLRENGGKLGAANDFAAWSRAFDKLIADFKLDHSTIPPEKFLELSPSVRARLESTMLTLSDATATQGIKNTTDQGGGNNYRYLSWMPNREGNFYVNIEGKLYYVGGRTNYDQVGYDNSMYTVTDVDSGAVRTLLVKKDGATLSEPELGSASNVKLLSGASSLLFTPVA
jgi:hypothetical protein